MQPTLKKKIVCGDFPGGPVARLCTPNIRSLGLIPSQGSRSHMLQLKIPHSATKTQVCVVCVLKIACMETEQGKTNLAKCLKLVICHIKNYFKTVFKYYMRSTVQGSTHY